MQSKKWLPSVYLSPKAILPQFRENMNSMLIQILRWLMQPKVWRFVGFASAVVGLLCYALSSSFNHLFGEWNMLKIFLYIVFSFIICLMILYAKIWQHSTSLRFKAHSAFLVLTFTSVYSFFSDKVMNGKPDAYSLISCAAFAIMSLSLSRQPRCGFEVDLLYFFLGCLIVQLMKIKLRLVIVGAGFSYSLILLRSSFSSIHAAAENEYSRLQDVNSVVIEVDSPQMATSDIASMMEQLRTCVKALQQENSNLIDMLLKQVKEYLEDDSELLVTDPNFMIDALPPQTINDLQETAKLMVSAGFEKECSEVYSCYRREYLEECLINKLLGLQKLSIEDVHNMPFKDLEDEIAKWIKASNVALKILFPSERRLCGHVFSGLSSAADFSFTEVCRGSTVQLLNFADAVAVGSRSPERLFRILDMFETLRDQIPEFESLFTDQCIGSLRNEAITIWKRLGEAIRGIFMELKNLIRQDQEKKVAVTGGGLHPITLYVMNYLRAACQSRRTLVQAFEDSSLSVQMHWIMEQLESNLEAKSKFYKDPALGYVFLTNNGTYIAQRAKDSELGTLLGDDWIREHTAKVWQYQLQYQRTMGTIIHTSMQDLPRPGSYGGDVQQLRYKDTQRIGEIGGKHVEGSERSNGSEGEMHEIDFEMQEINASRSLRRKSGRKKYPEERTIVISPAPLSGNTKMPPEDGFTWRKYGQKTKLGCKYPRNYYRCTHWRKLSACEAKKQVQRLHNNPSLFEVRYLGEHTCRMSSTVPSLFSPPQLRVDISKEMRQTTMPPELSPSSTSVSGWPSSVNLDLLGGGVSSSSGSAGSSTSKYGSDYPVADMTDAMFNSGTSNGNRMESFFPPAEDKWEPGNEAVEVQNRMRGASRDLSTEFGNLISCIPEAKLVAPADGRHHPMMDNVVGYLVSASRSPQILKHILQEYPNPKVANGAGTSSFIAQMERTLELLDIILLVKSENYEDPALRHFFMMNNWRHLEVVNESRELEVTFGDVWFQNNRAKVLKNLELYQGSSWNKVLDFLKLDSNELVAPNIAVESMEDKLHLFNVHFREICRVQCTWSVHDEKLREEIIISLENILLPAYGIFIRRFQDILKNHAYDSIEYGIFDIEDRLNCLFLGSQSDESKFSSDEPFVFCSGPQRFPGS